MPSPLTARRRGMLAALAGPTRPAGSEIDDWIVIGLANVQPLFGNCKGLLRSHVPPACNTMLSPQFAAYIAACRSPPAGTTIVAALAGLNAKIKVMAEPIKAAFVVSFSVGFVRKS